MVNDMKALIAAAEARAKARQAPAPALRSVVPLTEPAASADTAVTTPSMPLPASMTGTAPKTAGVPEAKTLVTSTAGLAVGEKVSPAESAAPPSSEPAQIPVPPAAPATASAEVPKPPPLAPLVPASLPRRSIGFPPRSPTPVPPSAAKAPTGEAKESEAPKDKTPLEEALAKVASLEKTVRGLAKQLEDLAIIVVNSAEAKDIADIAEDVRSGEPCILDEVVSQNADHVEILRTAVINVLLSPDPDVDVLAALAKSHSPNKVKGALEGLAADPTLANAVLIAEAANANGVKQSEVTNPGDSLVAQKAAEWVASTSTDIGDRAKQCLDSWDSIIGGD